MCFVCQPLSSISSVSKLTRDLHCYAKFFPGFCVFQDLITGKVKAIGKEEEGLYTLPAKGRQYNTILRRSLAVK